mgnify:CR=1 FL=1
MLRPGLGHGTAIGHHCLVILHVDGAGVAHPDRIAGLAQREDDVLIVLADIVHAGVVPCGNMVLRHITVRGIAFIVTLKQETIDIVYKKY